MPDKPRTTKETIDNESFTREVESMNKSEIAERAQQYTKKPVTIWAFRYKGSNVGDVLFWIGSSDAAIAAVPNRLAFVNDAGDFLIRTLESGEGYHVVSVGDYVVQGVAGEFYPCKPDIFAKTYDFADVDGNSRPKEGTLEWYIAERERLIAEVGQLMLRPCGNEVSR